MILLVLAFTKRKFDFYIFRKWLRNKQKWMHIQSEANKWKNSSDQQAKWMNGEIDQKYLEKYFTVVVGSKYGNFRLNERRHW